MIRHRYSARAAYFAYGFFGLFAVYTVNLLLGKASLLFGWHLSYLLGDVGEFLVLLAVALLFALATLLREALKSAETTD